MGVSHALKGFRVFPAKDPLLKAFRADVFDVPRMIYHSSTLICFVSPCAIHAVFSAFAPCQLAVSGYCLGRMALRD